MNAFVTAQLTEDVIDRLSGLLTLTFGGWGYEGVKLTPKQLVERAQSCEILIIGYEDIDEYVLKNLPQLRYIACTRGGMENIDVALVKKYGVMLSNTPGRNASAVADLTIGLMLSVARFIPQTYRYIWERRWEDVPWDTAGNTPYKRFAGLELEGKKLGLIGFGAIGRKVAKRALGFDMDVWVYDPYLTPEDVAGAAKLVDLPTLLAQVDFVSLHCKLTKDTKGLMNKETLGAMKSSAYLVNTARGALVNEEDLYHCLKEQNIAGAGLDVLIEEPMNRNHPFLELSNVIVTPHIGGASHDILHHQSSMIMQDIVHFIDGKRPVHAVH
ncbi:MULTISPECIES: NAD(P)-dependent oxidoreductase [unclassified Paenibacillus]|uniref:NAD(P)-dependent oxidoreductase n=1 Tax=unclassified Paenibacillus TaxID=185978 RepID=UPI0006D076AA|nr:MULTISPECIES: NAD(P)-dependent oxidoreductase [unclassified Paenibacillus]